MDDLRYPIGRVVLEPQLTPEQRQALIEEIGLAPGRVREALTGLGEAQMDTPYREGGWTVRQVVHHLPDSHVNGYARFRLALTEDRPTIKPYDQALWAELPDARSMPVEPSLQLLEALHARWGALLRAMTPEQFARRYVHPEENRESTLDAALQIYGWHGRHHVSQILALRGRRGW